MIVAGIDPGLQQTGYAVLQRARAGRVAVVDAGIITSAQRLELPRRLAQIAEGLDAVLDDHNPALVAVEELYAHYRHPRTAILMGHARGLVLLAAARRDIPVSNFSATAIKKNLTGNGRAKKEQVRQMILQTLGLTGPTEPFDAYDALAVALCHINHSLKMAVS